MDGNTIALVSVVSSAVLGAVGLIVASYNSSRERAHALALAREARQQERLADAYVEVLRIVEEVAHWAQRVRPMLDTSPLPEPPPLPSIAEQIRMQALLGAFASEDVQARYEAWCQSVYAIQAADMELTWHERSVNRHGQSGIDDAEVWRRLALELKPKERVLRQALIDTVAAELGHR